MNDDALSRNELLHALENAGRTPDLDLIRACLARSAELEPALLALLLTDPWQKYGLEDDADPRAYGEVHAGHLLIAARSLAALPIFAEIFRAEQREHLIEWFSDKLPHYGAAALPVFTDLMLEEGAFEYGRSSAAGILRRIALREPEHKPAVIASLRQLLPPLPEGDRPIVGEDEFDEMWTWAVLELSYLGDEESQEQVKALFAADALETWIIGGYDEYQLRLAGKYVDLPTPYDILQTYEDLRRREAREAAQKVLWARQEQERRQKAARQEQQAAARAAAPGARPGTAPEPNPTGEPTTRKQPKVGRNDPCPCGSGKKYKKCHGRPGGS